MKKKLQNQKKEMKEMKETQMRQEILMKKLKL
jgi:hypothetical protein